MRVFTDAEGFVRGKLLGMGRLATITAVVVLLLVGSAQASTQVVSPNPIYQQWVDEARVPTPDTTLTVREFHVENEADPCRHSWACATFPTDGESAIWLDPRIEPKPTFLHELGHHYEDTYLDATERQTWADFVGMPAEPWRAPSPSASERFASAYSGCARQRKARDKKWKVSLMDAQSVPSWTQKNYRAACRLIRSF